MEIEGLAIEDNEIMANEAQAVQPQHEFGEQGGDYIAEIEVEVAEANHGTDEPGGRNVNAKYNDAPLSHRQKLNKHVRRKSSPRIKTYSNKI